jgi:peroxiredoxin family protein
MTTTTIEEAATTGQAMEADTKPEREPIERVSIICSKGTLDMAYPGLVMANGARMMGIEAMVFFTFWGLDIITEKKIDSLHVATVGNPSMPIPTMVGGLPGMEAMATKMMKKQMDDLEIPPVREFIEMLSDSGAELYACRMAMDMFKLEEGDLVPQVDEVLTVMDFYDKSAGSQIIFI